MTGMSMVGQGGNMANRSSASGMSMNGSWYDPAVYASWPAVTGLLSLMPAEIQALLAQGNSLAEIAATKGITRASWSRLS